MNNARIVLVCLGVLACPSVLCLGCPDDDPIAIIAERRAEISCTRRHALEAGQAAMAQIMHH